MTYQLLVINTAPEYGRKVMHSAAKPWAVAEFEVFNAGQPDHRVNITRILGRYPTRKGAHLARSYRTRQELARREAIRIECEKPVPYGC
jgi:predicted GTPase